MSTDTPGPVAALPEVRHALRTATHDLLGDTIQVSDDDWGGPSGLPGWTRAELAAHIARHADAVRGVIEGALRGEDVPLYPTPEARESAIRAGAGRDGLAIQEDLDASSSALEDTFDRIHDWTMPVLFRGTRVPVAALALGRLAEVAIHHIDLAIGAGFGDLDPDVAVLVLGWAVERIGSKPDAPALRLVAPDGREWTTPAVDDAGPTQVSADPAQLLGWLAGRLPADAVSGADGVVVPSW
ncbi:maleylpyruvate isomerase family mycothiol-dependent enzyme [Raineyella fluvialis]|uniref:maleylpyruvate isomerase family mycothiol-dependent enzyme n=1 Tax=Raineyella fluvialis TaxID=2662261 RepID=UPI001E3E783F|nr:maleylpyruvate isomerase family mycothiol-dependent enzyme [Raineyella fluvialis]